MVGLGGDYLGVDAESHLGICVVLLYYACMTQKMGAKGQVVIPKDLRDRVGLGPGSDVSFEPLDDGVVVRRADRRAKLRGRFSGSGMASRLLEDHRKEPR